LSDGEKEEMDKEANELFGGLIVEGVAGEGTMD